MAVSKAHLHSTMYLLKPNKLATGNKNPVFTFHYVSIKTCLVCVSLLLRGYLHSTMYLLKLKQIITQIRLLIYLHSTMYLLKRI